MPYSYSQLRTYQTCPRQYEYAFIKKLGKVISPGESFGSSIHNTLKKWGELEMAANKKSDSVREDQLALFIESPHQPAVEKTLNEQTLIELWHQSFIFEGYESRVEAEYQRNLGDEILRKFFTWWSEKPHDVIAVEKGFTCNLTNGECITGRFDRVERSENGLTIIDFKSGGIRDQISIDADLQLSIYALAAQHLWKESVETLMFIFLTPEGMTIRETTRNQNQLDDAAKSIKSIVTNIEVKDFRPTPAYIKCSRCPYRSVCDVAAA